MRGTVQLYGGSFSGVNIVTKDYSDTINEGVYVTDLLALNRTYRHTDGSVPADFYVQTISDVKVVPGLTPVPYVDETGANATATEYTQIEPTTANWTGGLYVVKGNVTTPRECDRFRGHAGHRPLRRGEPDGAGRHHPPRWEPCAPDHLRPDRRDGNHDRHEQERRGRHDG